MKMNLKNAFSTTVPVVGGAIAAKFAKNLSGKFIQNEQLKAALPLVLGIMLTRQSNASMKHLGYGMIAVGGADLAGTFIPAIKGIEDMDLSGLFGDDINGRVLNDELNDQVLNDEITGDYD